MITDEKDKIEIRPLYDLESGTWTYLLLDLESKQSVLIDPVLERIDRDLNYLKELGFTLSLTVDTHMHADHITSAGELRDKTHCESYASEYSGANCASKFLKDGDVFTVGNLKFQVIHTPGHTPCSISLLLNGKYLFTGDALFVRGCGRTDFQGGNAESLYKSITEKLFSLPDDTIVLPGHDYKGFLSTTIGEEKKWNPRIAGKSLLEFKEIMDNLNLPEPKKIHEAVPANRACGKVL
ncbi:MBL fold metallo-hydrolase [Leptospira bandrabouensis]|uniref:MBL fold metallo-hydrolase n=1 Tax=Leptospira bandrabouensis TaxID=2484903 RepID=UPI001EEC0DC3|nr:MBL fold metallo-hydrolase [Leptospira bandrabouensis]MCG6145959.1 MBL fold metallo-hydrolase [Leptospira bandrabouensis]MCG6165546.1 MBL fold metallo-hydrolase [Leptospira bandrabouensis]